MIYTQALNTVEISILAGNSRVSLKESAIVLEPQLGAFRAALAHARDIQGHSGRLPKLFLALDHRGDFAPFAAGGFEKKRNLHLSQLHPAIIKEFRAVAEEFRISLNDITILREGAARAHAEHMLCTQSYPAKLAGYMGAVSDDEQNGAPQFKISCGAVAYEYFARAAQQGARTLEIFFEQHPWTSVGVYQRGVMLMNEMNVNVEARLRLVDGNGKVHSGGTPKP